MIETGASGPEEEVDQVGTTDEAEPPEPAEDVEVAEELEATELDKAPPDPTESAHELEATELDKAPPDPTEVASVAEEFVTGLVSAMNLDADISTRVEEDTAHVDVTGEDLGVLIGRRGQTLDAVQEIARTAVQRRLRARVRLIVDVEGYRDRRRHSLAEYAKSMARRAKERGTEIELEPMNAYERKIVHDAVADIDGATSFSEGEEPYRKVVVRGA